MKRQEVQLTQELLKEMLHYDPVTGVFTRKVKTSHNANVGDIAGSLNKHDGYIEISIFNKSYRAHRLAWLYEYGVWPECGLDHKDTIRHHNWIDNLRLANQSQNMQNVKKPKSDNLSGFLGVYYSKKRNKFIAQIRFDGVTKNLGAFITAQDAHNKYLEEKRKNHEYGTL